VVSLGVGVGEKGAKAVRRKSAMKVPLIHAARTCVYPSNVHERCEEEHEDDAHAKDLDAAAGHVEHECLHGEGFGGGDGEVPCALFFEGCVGGCCCFGGGSCLVGVVSAGETG